MKTVSGAMLAHLQGGITTLATGCKVTRDDGTIFGFTDHDEDVTISGVTYVAKTGYVRSAFSQKSDLSVPNMEVAGAIDSAGISDIDVRAGAFDYAQIRFFLYNWADLTIGVVPLPGHHLGQVVITDHGFKAEILGLADLLKNPVTRLFLPSCDADFADKFRENRCKLDPADFTETGTVTAVSTARRVIVADVTGSHPDSWFVPAGELTFTSGANNGRTREVKTDTLGVDPSRTLTLWLPSMFDIEIGDTFNVIAGCNHAGRLGDCKLKFNNYINFRGFDDVPGLDAMFSTPNAF